MSNRMYVEHCDTITIDSISFGNGRTIIVTNSPLEQPPIDRERSLAEAARAQAERERYLAEAARARERVQADRERVQAEREQYLAEAARARERAQVEREKVQGKNPSKVEEEQKLTDVKKQLEEESKARKQKSLDILMAALDPSYKNAPVTNGPIPLKQQWELTPSQKEEILECVFTMVGSGGSITMGPIEIGSRSDAARFENLVFYTDKGTIKIESVTFKPTPLFTITK